MSGAAVDASARRLAGGSNTQGWHGLRRLLCVRMDNLGDLLMTTPAIRALRQDRPDRHLTLLTSRAGAALAPHLPDVDDVIVWDAPWVANASGASADVDRERIATIAAAGCEAAVIFTVHSQSALPAAVACRMAGIDRVLAHVRENPYRLVSDWVPETEPAAGVRHEVQRQLDLVAEVARRCDDTRLQFRLRAADRQAAREALTDAGVAPDAPYLVLHPGASAPSRRYPAERYAEVARLLAQRPGWPIVVTGGTGELELVERVRAGAPGCARVLVGPLTLGTLAGLIAGARLLVGNNSGPAHLAAALGTPVVDVYALTNPQHTPWRVPSIVLTHDVPCRDCGRSRCPQGHHQCLRGIAPETIAQAACGLAGLRTDAGAARC